jgi:hypothetical protein
MFALFLLVLSSAVVGINIDESKTLPREWLALYGVGAVITVSGTEGYSEGASEYIGAFLLLFAMMAYVKTSTRPIHIILLLAHTAVTLVHMISDERYTDIYVSSAFKVAAAAAALYRYRTE